MNFKKIWAKAKPIISGVAPLAATALGGPFGGVAATLIRGALGVDDGIPDEEVVKMLASGDPDTLLKLKDIDAELEKFRIQAGIDKDKMYLVDVADARARHIQVRDKEPARLTYISMCAIAGLVIGLVIYGNDLPAYVASIVGIVVGEMLAAMQKGFNFFLGSSAGSKEKAEKISEIIERGIERDSTGDGSS